MALIPGTSSLLTPARFARPSRSPFPKRRYASSTRPPT